MPRASAFNKQCQSMQLFVGEARQQQLVHDRRYGWLYEEWTPPKEFAMRGGRGMFSVVPLGYAAWQGVVHMAIWWADVVEATAHAAAARSSLLKSGLTQRMQEPQLGFGEGLSSVKRRAKVCIKEGLRRSWRLPQKVSMGPFIERLGLKLPLPPKS